MRVLHAFVNSSYTTRELENVFQSFEFHTIRKAVEKLAAAKLIEGAPLAGKAKLWSITAAGMSCINDKTPPPPMPRVLRSPIVEFGANIGQCRSVFDLGAML